MQSSNTTVKNNECKKDDDIPVVNLNAFLERLDGDEEVFEQFMNEIPQHLTDSFENLLEAIKNNSREEIECTAHSLKGLSLNLEMHKITSISLKIELLARENKLNDVAPLVSELKNDLQKALEYIKKHKNRVLEAI